MSFNFPYDTCEASNQDSFVKQPFSFGVGILTLLILSWFIYNAKTVESKVLLGTLFAFEAFHAYSHMVHVQDFVQTRVIHGLAYFVNAALLWALSSSTRHFPETWIIAVLIGLVALDIYAFLYMPLVAYISTQFLLFFVIIAYFLRWLPTIIKQCIPWLSVIVIFIVILQINEQLNCASFMQWAPWFPWHIFIELAGLVAIVVIANMFSGIGLARVVLWDRGLYR